MEQKVQGDSYWKRRHILFDKYRVVVGGIGIVYEGALKQTVTINHLQSG